MSRYVDIDKLKFPFSIIGYDENGDALLSIRDVMRILEKSVEEDVVKLQPIHWAKVDPSQLQGEGERNEL